SEDDVVGRLCDILDRKLFESQVAAEVTAVAADVHGFEETVAALLGILARIVDYDLAAVMMLDDRTTYLTVAREASTEQYHHFFRAVADAATQSSGYEVTPADLVPRVADPQGLLGADEGGMATFLSMPHRAPGRIV